MRRRDADQWHGAFTGLVAMADPVGAARVQMSRGALAPPEESPSSWPQGESASGGASASSVLSGEGRRDVSTIRPFAASDPIGGSHGSPSPLSASGHAAEPAWHPSPPTGVPAVRLVPGLDGRAQLLIFAGVFFGPTLGWALGVIFGVAL